MNYYFYAKEDVTYGRTQVFAVEHTHAGVANDMAKKKALKLNMELAGGYFTENAKPAEFDRFHIIKVYKNTKPFVYKADGRLQKPVAAWDMSDIEEEVKWRVSELTATELDDDLPDATDKAEMDVREAIWSDSDYWTNQWDFAMETLGEFMKRRNKKSDGRFWRVTGEDMGWMHRSGEKYIDAEDPTKLIHAILPETDCTWMVYRHRNGLKIRNYHHDSPTGETYYVTGVTEAGYDKGINNL